MRIIWRIFVQDVLHATRNVIAIIVAMGLVIVPALYAWFNIAASWDPYSNTKALKVAVANDDDGYKSDLIPVKVNVGETVVSALRANHDLDWQFVDHDRAVDGVTSGDYYAAIVIPNGFSSDMMTLFSSKVEHAKLEYYVNEKINPIAPEIMDQGAGTVATTIDQTFAKTIGQVGLDLASQVLKYAQSPEMQDYVKSATGNITGARDQLNTAAAQLDAYAGLLGSVNGILDSTNQLLGKSGSAADGARTALDQAVSGANSVSSALSGASGTIGTALSQSAAAYDEVSKQVDEAFANIGTQTDQISKVLATRQADVETMAAAFGAFADATANMAASASSQAVKDVLNAQVQRARDAQTALNGLADAFGRASVGVAGGMADVNQNRDQLKQEIAGARAAVDAVGSDYQSNLKPQLDSLAASLSDATGQTSDVLSALDGVVSNVSGLSDDLGGGVAGLTDVMGKASAALKDSAAKLDDLAGKFSSAVTSGLSDGLSSLSGADPDTIAALLSAPVSVNRVAVFPIANYGSQMAPFYTILSIWVGAIVLAAMLKVTVSDRQKARILGLSALPDSLFEPRTVAGIKIPAPGREAPGNAAPLGILPHHEYLGRYGIFMLLALLQSTLVCLGDIYFLGVQADHVLQFLAVGWLASIVFSNIVYTLTVSFGDIGKAIAVVLLVMQVAGAGGTFPIQTLPGFFQAVYPWLPFPHGIDAMHSAMAGAYGNEYWISMLELAMFLLPSLLLGLVLRAPVMRLNTWVIRNLESTKVM